MSLLQRIARRFGFVKVGTGKRAEAPSANWHMAQANRLTASWTTTSASADSQARQGLSVVRARARQLRDDNDYGAKFIHMVKVNVLGESGIHFKSNIRDPDRVIANKVIPGAPDAFANKTITDAWWKWGRKAYCTIQRDKTWADVQRIVLEAVATDGECIIRKMADSDPDNPFHFTLKLYESSKLDVEYNDNQVNGNEVRMGVEFDSNGRRVAYHLLTNDPSESYFWKSDNVFRERVSAREIIHLGISRRIDQTRFTPWMQTSGWRLNMVGKYEEATAVQKRLTASKMAFITKQPGTGAPSYNGETDPEGNKVMDAEPGAIEELEAGQDIKTVDWNDQTTDYSDFMKAALRGVAAGLGVSYNTLANDMESVNFASGKLGLFEERELWKAIQGWFIESFCEEVFSSWLYVGLSTGAFPLPFSKFEKFNAPVFRGRRWAHINPEKEVAANISKLRARLTSITRILAEENVERDELFDEIAADNEALSSRGITQPELEEALAKAATPGMDDEEPDKESAT